MLLACRLYHEVMAAARIARAVHAEFARRIGAEKISLQHAVFDHFPVMRGDAVIVEGTARERPRYMRAFADIDVRREYLFAETIDKKRCLAIEAAATRGIDKI